MRVRREEVRVRREEVGEEIMKGGGEGGGGQESTEGVAASPSIFTCRTISKLATHHCCVGI